MSAWNRFLAKIRRTAGMVGNKVEECGDEAAASVHAKSLEIQIDEEYENLGRIVYRALNSAEDLEEQKQEVVNKLDELIAELDAIKTAKAEKKAAKEQAKAEEKAAKKGEKKEADACADCTDKTCADCPDNTEAKEPAGGESAEEQSADDAFEKDVPAEQ